MQIGLSEAAILMKKISSFGDPRLYALALVAEHLSKSTQPLVPERVFVTGGSGASANGTDPSTSLGMVGQLVNLLIAEKSGFGVTDIPTDTNGLKDFTERMTKEAMATMEGALTAPPPPAPSAPSAPPARN